MIGCGESLICRTLALYVVQIPVFYTLFSSPDNVLQMLQRTAVVLVFAAVAQRVITGVTEPQVVRAIPGQIRAS